MEEDFVGKCHYLKDSLVKNHRDSLRRSSGCELEIQKRKVPAAMCAIGKRKTTQGFFVLCLNRATAGGGVAEGTRGREDKREEASHSCPAWGPKYEARSSSPRHQPSVLACHYFTSHRAHTPSLRHTYAHLYHCTLSVLPWSTLKCCQHQILKHCQLKIGWKNRLQILVFFVKVWKRWMTDLLY